MNITRLRHGLGMTIIASSLFLMFVVYWPNRQEVRTIAFPSEKTINQEVNSSLKGSIWLKNPTVVWARQTNSIRLQINSADDIAHQTILSRLDLPGTLFTPNGVVIQTIQPGETVNFAWRINVPSQGNFAGTIWIYQASPVDLTQQAPEKKLLAAIPIQLVVKSILGLGWKDIQIISWTLSVIGLAMIYEVFLPWIRKLIVLPDHSNS